MLKLTFLAIIPALIGCGSAPPTQRSEGTASTSAVQPIPAPAVEPTQATTPAPATPAPSSGPGGVQVTRDFWVEGMRTQLPAYFCQHNQHFRRCFDVSEQMCLQHATESTATCLQQSLPDLPPVFHQPADGQRWGGVVGECAGAHYEAALEAKRHTTPECISN